MHVFKANRRIYLTNELISWLCGFVFIALFYFGFRLFSHLTDDELVPIVIGALFLKLGDTLTQYHVTKIHIDGQKNLLVLVLYSAISGEKVKKYRLEEVRSELRENSGLKKFLYYPILLKIFVAPKGTFRINNRYGFSTETLVSIANTLKPLGRPVVA